MDGFLVSLLNLFGLVLVVRLTLPARYALLNPYAAAVDGLLSRLFGFLRSALPLPPKGLCLVVLALVLASQAALAARQGLAVVNVSVFALFSYPAKGFLGWLEVATLRFFGFYVTLQAAALFLRLWHLGRPLPGFTGDLLRLAGRPLTSLPLWGQLLGTALVLFTFVSLAAGRASGTVWPMAEAAEVQGLLGGMGLPNVFDLSALPAGIRNLFLAGALFAGVAIQAQGFLLLLLIVLLISHLLRAAPTIFFLTDAVRLFTGPIPPFRLGAFDLSPLAAYFALGMLSFLLTGGLLFVARMASYVV